MQVSSSFSQFKMVKCYPCSIRRLWLSNFPVKFSACLLMLLCGFIALTGRGVVSIIQSIIGIIFAIEGFWGCVKYSKETLKKYLIFLILYFIITITISIIDLETLSEYCSSAETQEQEQTCLTTTKLYSDITLAISATAVPIIFLITLIFYLRLLRQENLIQKQIQQNNQNLNTTTTTNTNANNRTTSPSARAALHNTQSHSNNQLSQRQVTSNQSLYNPSSSLTVAEKLMTRQLSQIIEKDERTGFSPPAVIDEDQLDTH